MIRLSKGTIWFAMVVLAGFTMHCKDSTADGTFTIHHVPSGTWTVTMITDCLACAGFSKSVTVPPGARGLQLIWEQD